MIKSTRCHHIQTYHPNEDFWSESKEQTNRDQFCREFELVDALIPIILPT